MNESDIHGDEAGCSCGCDRRGFLAAIGAAAGGGLLWSSGGPAAAAAGDAPMRTRQGATVRTVFIYPPSSTFAGPDGWWSWPGNEFDAEGRQKQYMAALKDMEKRLGVTLAADNSPVANAADACMVQGHHNLLFCGDFARKFRLFAQLHRMELVDSGYKGTWPL